MKKIFVTYGDAKFCMAKKSICEQASLTGQFDVVTAYGPEDLSEDVRNSEIFKIPRGGGLWIWKPDVILKTMDKCQDGDIIVYCDAGCSVSNSSEWQRWWKILKNYDVIVQRIFQRTDHWTRRELLDAFSANGRFWTKCYQYQATIIIKVSSFTRSFVSEWRSVMLNNPKYVTDVTDEERGIQLPCFRENRHDQAVYSALVYKYLHVNDTRKRIYTMWERVEDCDPLFKQAIRATRLRHGEVETREKRRKAIMKRMVKHYIYKPFYYAPLQSMYSCLNILL